MIEASGQSVRFQFDYVHTVIIQDPNGTTNAALPRIDHHTVSTEVQLNNFEIAEISRFESNSQLGSPAGKWGGIPILKDIPFLSEFPLIGWFSMNKARQAVVQQSIIIAHAVTYPTIVDMMTLLSAPRSRQEGG